MKYTNIKIINRCINVFRPLLLISIGLFIWFTYEELWLSLFDKYIIPYLDISTNIWLTIVSSIFITLAVFVLLRMLYYKYRITTNQRWILLVFCGIYAKYRFGSLYQFSYYVEPIAYLDIITIFAFFVVFVDFINYLCNSYSIHIHKHQTDSNKWISDQPICNEDEDFLEYKFDVQKLAEDLNNIPFGQSWSIGVVSQWGTGKSSFLNLVEKAIDPKSYIVINFNPRNAKNVQSIQGEFFSTLSTSLKPYNASFSNMFRTYMEALQIFDNKNIISTILKLQKITDKKSAKEKINSALRKISKKIIIIIEDFDRLFSDEIIEIFKLIDGNASFPNVIFLTAYDKTHLNKMIMAKYGDEDTPFSDKFFSYEKVLPIRPYKKIYDYLETKIINGININKEEQDIYKSILNGYYNILERYLTNVRDVKRFINLFLNDYLPVKEEVVFQNFFLLSIIKYKDPTIHKLLFKKEYLEATNSFYTIKKEKGTQEINIPFLDILEKLFPKDNSKSQENFRSISSIHAFEIYFVTQVFDLLKKHDMEELLIEDFDLAKKHIDQWDNENRINDLKEFFSTRNLNDFANKSIFISYIRIVLYLICKNSDSVLYLTIQKLLLKNNTKNIVSRYSFNNEEDYINNIKKILNNYPPYHYEFTKKLIINSIEEGENYIFTKSELLTINKDYLIDSLKDDTMKEIHMSLLYSCISAIMPDSNKVILDQSSCERIIDMIENSPNYYINNFVRLGMISSSPDFNTIACEPFWESIFKEKEVFESFINDTKLDSLEKIKLVRNFWELYKNNDYSPISIERENVQSLIDNDLKELINRLRVLQDIQKEINESEVARSSTNTSGTDLDGYQKLYERITDNRLFIKFTGKVHNSIKEAIKKHSDPQEEI